jgi:uncharacterized protein
MYFVVTRERGAAWNDALSMPEQRHWAEHAAFMNALADDGFVVLGGPISGTRRFLLIVRAESEQAIRARPDPDPWTPMGLLTIVSIEPWQILLGDPDG